MSYGGHFGYNSYRNVNNRPGACAQKGQKGEFGPGGAPGPQGPQGPQGIKGEKGMGITGSTGAMGVSALSPWYESWDILTQSTVEETATNMYEIYFHGFWPPVTGYYDKIKVRIRNASGTGPLIVSAAIYDNGGSGLPTKLPLQSPAPENLLRKGSVAASILSPYDDQFVTVALDNAVQLIRDRIYFVALKTHTPQTTPPSLTCSYYGTRRTIGYSNGTDDPSINPGAPIGKLAGLPGDNANGLGQVDMNYATTQAYRTTVGNPNYYDSTYFPTPIPNPALGSAYVTPTGDTASPPNNNTTRSLAAFWFIVYGPQTGAGAIMGPQGAQGAQGFFGLQGLQGIQGIQGLEGPPVDGGGVIPYEPYNQNNVSISTGLKDASGVVNFIQFTSPSTGNYTHIQVLTGISQPGGATSEFFGTIGAAIYRNLPGTINPGAGPVSPTVSPGPGRPGLKIGQGQTSAAAGGANMIGKYSEITFNNPIPLIADTKYWAAIAWDGSPGPDISSNKIWMPYNGDYSKNEYLVFKNDVSNNQYYSNTGLLAPMPRMLTI